MKKYYLLMIACISSVRANAQPLDLPELKNVSIVYNTNMGDTSENWEVFHRQFSGGKARNISQHKAVDWSYYGVNSVLYFISDRDDCYRCFHLYRCDTTGNNLERVSDLRLEDSWMSSRKQGAEMIVSGRLGDTARFQLFSIDLKNGDFRRITFDTAAKFSDPCYSPDGDWLVFSYKPIRRDNKKPEELFLMPADGGEMKRLTHYDGKNYNGFEYSAGSPRFHPNGEYISYISEKNGKVDIYAVDIQGNRHWKLIPKNEGGGWHDWSPDGDFIIYNAENKHHKRYEIILFQLSTGKSWIIAKDEHRSLLGPVFLGN